MHPFFAENPDPQESIQDPAFSHNKLQSSGPVDLEMVFVVGYKPYGTAVQKLLKSCDTPEIYTFGNISSFLPGSGSTSFFNFLMQI